MKLYSHSRQENEGMVSYLGDEKNISPSEGRMAGMAEMVGT